MRHSVVGALGLPRPRPSHLSVLISKCLSRFHRTHYRQFLSCLLGAENEYQYDRRSSSPREVPPTYTNGPVTSSRVFGLVFGLV